MVSVIRVGWLIIGKKNLKHSFGKIAYKRVIIISKIIVKIFSDIAKMVLW